MATMKEISKLANVSITSVSHYINKSRYISEKNVLRIEEAIHSLGYTSKKSHSTIHSTIEQKKTVGFIISDMNDNTVFEYKSLIEKELMVYGYSTITYLANDFQSVKELNMLYYQSHLDAVIIIRLLSGNIIADQIQDLRVPYMVLNNSDDITIQDTHRCEFDYKESVYKAISYLLRLGHEKIVTISDVEHMFAKTSIEAGAQNACSDFEKYYDVGSLVYTQPDSNSVSEICRGLLTDAIPPTAIFAMGNKVALEVFKYIQSNGYSFPKNISLIGYDIEDWAEICNPHITSVSFDKTIVLQKILSLLSQIIDQGDGKGDQEEERKGVVLQPHLIERGSTRAIGRGPFGETAENADVLELTKEDIDTISQKDYTAAISLHYTDTPWSRLVEKGIRDTCNDLGIKVLAVTDAHFNPNLQVLQLGSLLSMNPDVIMSIPTDEVLTAEGYRNIVESKTKLVLMTNVPKGLSSHDYTSCISLNERENGIIAGELMGSYMRQHKKTSAGFLVHGAHFFGTKQRDASAIQKIQDDYQDINIIATEAFHAAEDTYAVCTDLIRNHPEIEALYVTWEGPCNFAKKALIDLERTDIAVFTTDINYDIALDIADNGVVKGLSSQKPYEQGRAVALAAANGLLENSIPPFIGMLPYRITRSNLLSMWKDIFLENPPNEMTNMIRKKDESDE